jgi:hypothetical protein
LIGEGGEGGDPGAVARTHDGWTGEVGLDEDGAFPFPFAVAAPAAGGARRGGRRGWGAGLVAIASAACGGLRRSRDTAAQPAGGWRLAMAAAAGRGLKRSARQDKKGRRSRAAADEQSS